MGQACMKHSTEVRLGYELVQTTSTDVNSSNDTFYYWQVRAYPYVFGQLDILPYLGIPSLFKPTEQMFYLEWNAVFDSFDIGPFAEAIAWWDYTVDGTATRSVCLAYGYASDQIDFAFTT